MTHENLELRAWLAVNLMGLHKMQWIGLPGGRHPWGRRRGRRRWDDEWVCNDLPPYESTWDGMCLVVEAMRARGWSFRLIDLQIGFGPRADFFRDGAGEAKQADTAPMAVALAARAALEGRK